MSAAVANVSCDSASSGHTTIEIGNRVIQKSVKRLGMNLGSTSFYDASQMMKNLLFRNPGFEGEIYQSIIRCKTGTADSCTDENGSSDWPTGFWKGADYEFIRGMARGRSGKVTDCMAASHGLGMQVSFGDIGVPPQTGDYMILRIHIPGNGQAGWWPSSCCGGSVSTERKDLAPDTLGKQALLLSSAGGGEAAVSSFFGSSAGRVFVTLHGNYTLRFKAKATGGTNTLRVAVSRNSKPGEVFLARTLQLSRNWATYALHFAADETSVSDGMLQVDFRPDHSDVLLDDTSLEADTDQLQDNPTAFLGGVVQALRELRPGLLRYWGGQLGDTLDNQLEPPFARMRAGYSAWSHQQEDIRIGLPEFLTLCAAVSAEPYYVVPITFSVAEMHGLIEFLAGRSETAYGNKRRISGQAEPWTRVFPKIHLEFGNEAWNQSFRGGTIEDPTAYGERADELFRAARATAGYTAERFDLVVGGQAVYVDRNRKILAASGAHDTLALAPYQMTTVDSYKTNQDLFGPLLAEPQAITSNAGYMGQNASLARGARNPTSLAVYEVNVNTVGGSISQDALNALIPSQGSGEGVIENMLLSLRDLGIVDQMFWVLPQYSFRRGDGKSVKLYGAVVDMGVDGRKRPAYLALQLANSALQGDMIETRQRGLDPTWEQPAMNGVAKSEPKAIESFAFSDGTKRALILLNVLVTGALDVTFDGPNAPTGLVNVARLRSLDIRANNEESNNVVIEKEVVERFNAASDFLLAPHSMTLLRWEKKGRGGLQATTRRN